MLTLYWLILTLSRSNRVGLPVPLKTKKKEAKGNVTSYRYGNMMPLAWTDKRKILMLSTKHTAKSTQVQTR